MVRASPISGKHSIRRRRYSNDLRRRAHGLCSSWHTLPLSSNVDLSTLRISRDFQSVLLDCRNAGSRSFTPLIGCGVPSCLLPSTPADLQTAYTASAQAKDDSLIPSIGESVALTVWKSRSDDRWLNITEGSAASERHESFGGY